MTALLARAHVESLRLGAAVRRYWRRLLAGAFCGWVGSSVLGAFAVVWLESVGVVGSEQTSLLLGAAIVWSGIALGALVAYAMRPDLPVEAQPPPTIEQA